ncbi:MAG: hypothetical protein HY565_02900 [Candidatus Kerfeldbacteria bacterium]|nr:hypothetical protein [Candidatus Kerfeldbacteria bacterium]
MFQKICLILALLVPTMLQAATFNPHKIITDDDLTDYTRMSFSGIQNFLDREDSILATYTTTDIDGAARSAAEIIYNTSYRYRLNAQFLLATIQKESSLVTGTNTSLLDWVLGYGVCDSCSKTDPKVVKYKGFAKQLDAAGSRIRDSYLADLDADNSTVSGWGVGITKTTLDGVAITPQNQATAVLYTYTPWLGYYGGDTSVGGNSLLFDVMERFFPNRASDILYYPNLSLLQDYNTGTVYKLERNELRPITSYTALLANYDPSRIIAVDSSVIERYDEGDPIVVPKFILIQAPSGGIYLIDSDHKKRAITSAAVFRQLGYNPEEVIPVNQADVDAIPEAAPITEADKYPLGAVLQNAVTGAVVYLDDEQVIHPVWSKSILDNRFKGYAIHPESPDLIASYEDGSPETYADGTLLKIPERDTIYVIDHGKKRPILSDTVLDKLGGYESVLTTNKAGLKLHETGKPLRLTKSKTTKKKSK